jgi:hypothetical protein
MAVHPACPGWDVRESDAMTAKTKTAVDQPKSAMIPSLTRPEFHGRQRF